MPPQLAALCKRALAFEASERPQFTDVVAELQQFLQVSWSSSFRVTAVPGTGTRLMQEGAHWQLVQAATFCIGAACTHPGVKVGAEPHTVHVPRLATAGGRAVRCTHCCGCPQTRGACCVCSSQAPHTFASSTSAASAAITVCLLQESRGVDYKDVYENLKQ